MEEPIGKAAKASALSFLGQLPDLCDAHGINDTEQERSAFLMDMSTRLAFIAKRRMAKASSPAMAEAAITTCLILYAKKYK